MLSKDAEKFVRQQLIDNCCLEKHKERELKTTKDLLNWLSDYLDEPHKIEIHWFTTDIK